jgi:hypothetical protein
MSVFSIFKLGCSIKNIYFTGAEICDIFVILFIIFSFRDIKKANTTHVLGLV